MSSVCVGYVWGRGVGVYFLSFGNRISLFIVMFDNGSHDGAPAASRITHVLSYSSKRRACLQGIPEPGRRGVTRELPPAPSATA